MKTFYVDFGELWKEDRLRALGFESRYVAIHTHYDRPSPFSSWIFLANSIVTDFGCGFIWLKNRNSGDRYGELLSNEEKEQLSWQILQSIHLHK